MVQGRRVRPRRVAGQTAPPTLAADGAEAAARAGPARMRPGAPAPAKAGPRPGGLAPPGVASAPGPGPPGAGGGTLTLGVKRKTIPLAAPFSVRPRMRKMVRTT